MRSNGFVKITARFSSDLTVKSFFDVEVVHPDLFASFEHGTMTCLYKLDCTLVIDVKRNRNFNFGKIF